MTHRGGLSLSIIIWRIGGGGGGGKSPFALGPNNSLCAHGHGISNDTVLKCAMRSVFKYACAILSFSLPCTSVDQNTMLK